MSPFSGGSMKEDCGNARSRPMEYAKSTAGSAWNYRKSCFGLRIWMARRASGSSRGSGAIGTCASVVISRSVPAPCPASWIASRMSIPIWDAPTPSWPRPVRITVLLWIHPFIDGNGRVARLMSHAVLVEALDSGALWSVARGLARHVETYKQQLAACDLPRRNDLDGRGHLSEEALADFAAFFLDLCIDQVEFMDGLISLRDCASASGSGRGMRHSSVVCPPRPAWCSTRSCIAAPCRAARFPTSWARGSGRRDGSSPR
jgi:hypothetical protein